jgi:hypothetical protein
MIQLLELFLGEGCTSESGSFSRNLGFTIAICNNIFSDFDVIHHSEFVNNKK